MVHRKGFPSGWLIVYSISNILSAILAENEFFTFEECNIPRDNVFNIAGAVVRSQEAESYQGMSDINCTYIFMPPSSTNRFLVQLSVLDVKRRPLRPCPDTLTVAEYDSSGQQPRYFLRDFCGDLSDLQIVPKFYTTRRYLAITWTTGAAASSHRGFKLVLTAVSQIPVPCDAASHVRCSNYDCISDSLLCDTIKHCYNGSDEASCDNNPPPGLTVTDPGLGVSILPLPSPTRKDPPATSPPPTVDTSSDLPFTSEEVYLWLPLIVVVLFTGVMVTLILIGRKSDPNSQAANQPNVETSTMPKHFPTTSPVTKTTKRKIEITSPLPSRTLPNSQMIYIYLALAGGVILFTLLLCLMMGKPRNGNEEIEGTGETIALAASVVLRTDNLSTTHQHSTTHLTPEEGFTRTEVIYMTLMAAVFVFIVVVCLVIGKRGTESSADEISTVSGYTSEAIGLTDERNGLRIDVNGNPDYEPEPGMPSTPPPSYSVIERQTSYVSHISMDSSQMSEPPDYSDAIDLPGPGGAVQRTRSSRLGRHRSSRRNSGGSSASRFARLRNRIFSRSMSATETRRRRDSSTDDNTEQELDTRRISEVSDVVFVDETAAAANSQPQQNTDTSHSDNLTSPNPILNSTPVHHSTPDSQGENQTKSPGHGVISPLVSSPTSIGSSSGSSSSSSQQQADQQSGSAPAGAALPAPPRSDSAATGTTSLGSASANNIFAQIHSLNLNDSDNELDNEDDDREGNENAPERSESRGSSSDTLGAMDAGVNVSEMALLRHAEPPSIDSEAGTGNNFYMA